MADNWKPNANHEKYTAESGLDLDAATEEFVSWAKAGGHKYVDWDICFSRALRNWIPESLSKQSQRNAPAKDATGEPLRRMHPWGWGVAGDEPPIEWLAKQKEATA